MEREAAARGVAFGTSVGHRTFEHTADVGIEAWGDDLARAFEEAASAMFSLMVDVDAVEEREERRQSVREADRPSLLVSWLNDLIGLVDAEGLVFRRFAVDRLTESELDARSYGERLDPARHAPHLAIKAATHHAVSVEPGPPARVRVVLDV